MAVFRVTTMGVLFLQSCYNVLHFRKSDATSSDKADLAADIRDNYMVYVKPNMFTEFVWTNIQVKEIGSADAPYNLTVFVVGTAGSGASAAPSLAVVLKLQTGIAGRHGRGRIYLPAAGPACMVNGLFTAGCLASWQTMSNSILSRYGPSGASNFDLVVARRSDESDALAVTAIGPRATPGHQRRRTVGVGI